MTSKLDAIVEKSATPEGSLALEFVIVAGIPKQAREKKAELIEVLFEGADQAMAALADKLAKKAGLDDKFDKLWLAGKVALKEQKAAAHDLYNVKVDGVKDLASIIAEFTAVSFVLCLF